MLGDKSKQDRVNVRLLREMIFLKLNSVWSLFSRFCVNEEKIQITSVNLKQMTSFVTLRPVLVQTFYVARGVLKTMQSIISSGDGDK